MQNKISIAIDAMGGENSPTKTLDAVKIFLDKNKEKDDLTLLLCDACNKNKLNKVSYI